MKTIAKGCGISFFKKKFFFNVDHSFKSLLNLLQYYFYVLVSLPWDMWDLSFPTGIKLVFPALESKVLTTELPGKFLLLRLSHFNHDRLCETPWTAAHQAPLSTGFSRQEYWSGLPFSSPLLVSSIWQSDSVIHICVCFTHNPFHYGLLQDIVYSSLCYTVRPCLSILYIVVGIC